MTLLGQVLLFSFHKILGIPLTIALSTLNFVGVTLSSYLHMKFTLGITRGMSRRNMWKGIAKNSLLRWVSMGIFCPCVLWLFTAMGMVDSVSYWGAMSLAGGFNLLAMKIVFRA